MKASDYSVTAEQMARVLKGETVCLVPGKDGHSIKMNPDKSFEYIPNPPEPSLFMFNRICTACADNAVHLQNMTNRIKHLNGKLEKVRVFLKRMNDRLDKDVSIGKDSAYHDAAYMLLKEIGSS